jgi:hypothetical protein
MGNKTWKDMGFKLDNAAGTITDLSSVVNSQSLEAAITDLDTTGMGVTARTRVNGLGDISVSLNGFMNSTVDGILGPIMNGTSATKTAQFTAYTGRHYNGEFLPTAVSYSGEPDTLEVWSCTLVLTGALNRTSVALP